MIKRAPKRRKNPHAVAMVKRRNAKLSAEERSAIASNAATKRWAVNGKVK